MNNGVGKQSMSGKCVLCDREVKSSKDGWRFKNFNLCNHCIENIFKDII